MARSGSIPARMPRTRKALIDQALRLAIEVDRYERWSTRRALELERLVDQMTPTEVDEYRLKRKATKERRRIRRRGEVE